MTRPKRPQAYRVNEPPADEMELEREVVEDAELTQTIELREEQLVARKDLRDLGEIEVRTEVEEVPGRLEVDAYREEVIVEHEPVGEMVSERDKPWEEDGVLVIPIYEEQLVVTKRLMLKERMRVRRVGTTERQLFEDTLRRERIVVDDPQHTGLVHERYPVDETPHGTGPGASQGEHRAEDEADQEPGFLGNLVRKALE